MKLPQVIVENTMISNISPDTDLKRKENIAC